MSEITNTSPRGAKSLARWLVAAGIYNILWGAWVVLVPSSAFTLLGMKPTEYLFLWQCIGMIVGVYGLGYLIAATNHRRHWPIVLVGLLGKIFGPLGYLWGLFDGTTPPQFGLLLITNDLIWLYPFIALLRDAYYGDATSPVDSATFTAALDLRSSTVPSLRELSTGAGVLVVFLRHAGCTFCREAIGDLAKHREYFRSRGIRIALVTQGEAQKIESLCSSYKLQDVVILSDPSRHLYHAFELRRGSLRELFGPKVWLRGAVAALKGHGIGALDGDGFQMPGAFLLRDGELIRAYRHRSAADRPDYCELVSESGNAGAV